MNETQLQDPTVCERCYTSQSKPTWCPGCGDYGVLAALDKALKRLGRPEHEIAVVAGIGCSSRTPFFMNTYGFHSAHGRALTVATGLKTSRPDLTVIATGGDGDALAIGGNHFMHTMRRNVDITYILMDNQIYGMTKGQAAPTSSLGLRTKTTPNGSWEAPLDPVWVALTSGASFVAQVGSWDVKTTADLLFAAIIHEGTSFVNVLSPCVTFHKQASRDYFKGLSLAIPTEHDATDFDAAVGLLRHHAGHLPLGLIYRAAAPTYGAEIDKHVQISTAEERRRHLEAILEQYG